MDTTISPVNLGGNLLGGKGRTVGINTAIVMVPGSNACICFPVPMDRFKPAVEYIISTDCLLRMG